MTVFPKNNMLFKPVKFLGFRGLMATQEAFLSLDWLPAGLRMFLSFACSLSFTCLVVKL